MDRIDVLAIMAAILATTKAEVNPAAWAEKLLETCEDINVAVIAERHLELEAERKAAIQARGKHS